MREVLAVLSSPFWQIYFSQYRCQTGKSNKDVLYLSILSSQRLGTSWQHSKDATKTVKSAEGCV